MNATRVKLGFVGVGMMGQCAHLWNYVVLPECEVVALAEMRPELGRRVAERYGVPRVYRTHEEMLAKEKLDGLVASQPFMRHGELVPELLKAGIPVFTEKPLAANLEAGERIVAATRAHHTWVSVGYHKRSEPAVIYAKTEIDRWKQTGEAGKLRYVRLTMPPGDWVAGGDRDLIKTDEAVPELKVDYPPSMDAKTFEQFVGFVNYYIHQINLLRYLLGESYRVTYAEKSEALLVGESQSGVACTIEMSPYRTKLGWRESALVGFEYGYVKIEFPAPLALNQAGRVEVRTEKGTTSPQLPAIHAMRQQAINFIRAIRGEIQPLCDATEALEDLKLARDYIMMRGQR